MKKLIKGLRQFQAEYFSSHQELFEQLSHGQEPRVLFITCSDSRIDPNLITQTQVGELFIIRNAGNIIPPFGATNGGEGAAVEYAVHALGIEQIIVCGHSHCGAMKGLLQLGKLEEEMPLVYEWLRHAEATRRLVQENYSDRTGDDLMEVVTAENVLTQLENLRTYPVVRSKLHQGKLKLFGWVYEIETGEVLMYDTKDHAYVAPYSQLPVDLFAEIEPTNVLPETAVKSHPLTPAQKVEQSQPQPFPSLHPEAQPLPQPSAQSVRRFPHTRLSPEQLDRIYRGSGAQQ